MSEYIYDASWESERARLAALEDALDPVTTAFLDRIGVGPGWRCLEVGGGGGSIAAWLCERGAEVVATDLDPRFLEALSYDNLTVLRHDAVREAFPDGGFDLVHSRDMLEHIPERLEVLAKKVAALKPGGWIMVEDVDFELGLSAGFPQGEPLDELMPKVMRASARWMATRGVDASFGRHLPRLLLEHGLTDVGAQIHARGYDHRGPGTRLLKLSIEHLGPRLLEAGEVTAEELDILRGAADVPGFFGVGPMHVSAWGRAPG